MRVLAHVHRFCGPGGHQAGAEWMLHETLRYLTDQGHECRVIVARRGERFIMDGIAVASAGVGRDLDRAYAEAEVVITHLDVTRAAVQQAARMHKPLVHIVHNHRQLAFHRVPPLSTALVALNSEWLSEATEWRGRRTILRPHVTVERYRVEPVGDAVVLLNMTEQKGGDLFWTLASRLPRVRFIGVQGAYGRQETSAKPPPNVEVWEKQADARAVYREARLVIMPSRYESWGRVAVEAACSGIPTIAAPTPGLKESLGDAGVFCDVERPDEWEGAIRSLLGSAEAWQRVSEAVRDRALALERLTLADLARFEAILCELAAERTEAVV